ncbi:hypothetical protein BH20ACI3_BH20ACI3_14270 [soil metagenome]
MLGFGRHSISGLRSSGANTCKSGDWVSILKSNLHVLILPASEYVWGGGREKEEYTPPYYLKKQGVACLDLSTYESLRSKHSSFRPIDQIRRLSIRESTLLFQWNAQTQVLGGPPEVHLRPDIILASSAGDHFDYLKQLEALIQSQYDESNAIFRPVSDSEQVISFYLDAEEFIKWEALVFNGAAYRLLIDSRYVVASEATS